MTDIYFDNSFIYAENATRLLYFDTTWRCLEMMPRLPVSLTVASKPAGATLSINGRRLGVTPLLVTGLVSPVVTVSVTKDDHLSRNVMVTLPEGRHRRLVLTLPRTGDSCGTNRHTDDLRTLFAVTRRIHDLQDTLRSLVQSYRHALHRWDQSYPTMTERREFETVDAFTKRRTLFEELLRHRRNELTARIGAHCGEIQGRILDLIFTRCTIRLGRYRPEKRHFPIALRVDEGGHRFQLTGKVTVPPPSAMRLVEKACSHTNRNTVETNHKRIDVPGRSMTYPYHRNTHGLQVRLHYRYRVRKEPGEKRWRALYVYTALHLLFDGLAYPIEGSYSHSPDCRERDDYDEVAEFSVRRTASQKR
jgi:hypothetical protein